MAKIADYGNGVEIWEADGEFYVYGVLSDPRVCPSEDMARAVAAGG